MDRLTNKIRPALHHSTPFLQRITAAVSQFGCVARPVCQTLLREFPGEIRFVSAPISKR
jgi:hypothetical protein